MLVIEEIFLSEDENTRKKMLEDIVVYMVKHEKNLKNPTIPIVKIQVENEI